jgi:hypothetical protein
MAFPFFCIGSRFSKHKKIGADSLPVSRQAEPVPSKKLKKFRPYLFLFSHFWLATVQEVLQADWQDAWHSPQPPLTALSFRFAAFSVLICFNF